LAQQTSNKAPMNGIGRLAARARSVQGSASPGLHSLGIATRRDALLYVPPQYVAGKAAALMVSLHGAGGTAENGIRLLQKEADRRGFLLVAPASRTGTWDIIADRKYGPDVKIMDQTLRTVFDMCQVDERVAVSGFSDGASYALSLGLMNGDLFRAVLAFSPGFLDPHSFNGNPRIYISHGTSDHVLPITSCSRRIVPQLRAQGYTTNYREFDGPHEIPQNIRDEAIDWWLDERA
jgi:phospholipase/carboxylesterase